MSEEGKIIHAEDVDVSNDIAILTNTKMERTEKGVMFRVTVGGRVVQVEAAGDQDQVRLFARSDWPQYVRDQLAAYRNQRVERDVADVDPEPEPQPAQVKRADDPLVYARDQLLYWEGRCKELAEAQLRYEQWQKIVEGLEVQ